MDDHDTHPARYISDAMPAVNQSNHVLIWTEGKFHSVLVSMRPLLLAAAPLRVPAGDYKVLMMVRSFRILLAHIQYSDDRPDGNRMEILEQLEFERSHLQQAIAQYYKWKWAPLPEQFHKHFFVDPDGSELLSPE